MLAASTPMTAAEAQAAAAEVHAAAAAAAGAQRREATGFMGVVKDGGFKPFKAVLSHGGRLNHLGQFATAEEACSRSRASSGRRTSRTSSQSSHR